ncbi:unnamed protein product [Phytophthora lilii]|uniref:Unnamed protein product n=1 Tax=Phytophthora lilii TaxID=2077276 RepID=A0A9W7CSD3_9STRA|nr:unnamed protein product [Phytophthora lilii]
MPLAIVGIKYELAWTEYDTFAQNTKRLQLDRSLREKKPSSKLLTETSRRHILHAIVRPDEDEILEKIDSLTIKYASSVTCDRFYQLSQAIIQVTFSLEHITAPQENVKDSLMNLEAVIQSTKRRSDEASQALDGVMSLIKLHSRVCAEAHELLSALRTPSPDQETDLDRFISSSKLGSKDTHGFGSHRVSTMSRAKGAIAAFGSKAVKAITHHDYHNSSNTLRAKIWNTFEHRHVTQISRAVNKMRMFVVVLSIGVFYLQTTPELQKTGLKTFLCQRNVHDFCTAYDEPGCYVFRRVAGSGTTISVEVTEQPLDLHCSIGDPDEACYASGVNFGSDNFPLSCSEVFPSSSGIEHVCKNRLCNPSVQLLFDMEPYWIYVEFFFGLWFTGELALRVYSHPVRRHLWGDMKLHGHVIFLIPFYVELVEIMIGEWPTYSVVPAMPSFFTAVRFMKSLRILKLGSHIPGSRVLIRTAQLITDRLAIPVRSTWYQAP